MGVGEPVRLDTREEPEKGRRICDVRDVSLARTTGKEAANLATTVDDDSARITAPGEDTRLAIIKGG